MSRHHPHGETRKERRWQQIVGVGAVVIFLLLGVIVVQGVMQYRSQTNHHASTAKQQATIIAQNKVIEIETAALVAFHAQTVSILNQISALQSEFTQSVGMIPAVAASLTAGQNALIAKLNDIDARMDSLCSHLPSTVCPAS